MITDQRVSPNGAATLLPRLHTLKEAAQILRVGQSTLRAAARRREIGHLRNGRRLMFSDVDLADYIGARRVEAEATRRTGSSSSSCHPSTIQVGWITRSTSPTSDAAVSATKPSGEESGR